MTQERVIGRIKDVRESRAYRSGWEDGRFGPVVSFANSSSLAVWTDEADRLAYYRGHRDGRRIREMLRGEAGTA